MRLLLLAALTGCYGPSAPQGAPCVDDDHCPAPQRCAADGRCSLFDAAPDVAVIAPRFAPSNGIAAAIADAVDVDIAFPVGTSTLDTDTGAISGALTRAAGAGAIAGTMPTTNNNDSGGGGGGGGALGGAGGTAGIAAGGTGGAACLAMDLQPLAGGSGGGTSPKGAALVYGHGGGGGGALQLSALESATIVHVHDPSRPLLTTKPIATSRGAKDAEEPRSPPAIFRWDGGYPCVYPKGSLA